MALVEKFADTGPMNIGVGLEEDTVALYAEGADHIIAPSETAMLRKMRAFRTYDTIIIVRPTLLRVQSYRELVESSEGQGHFQVVGHDAVRLADAKSIEAFRALKAIVSKDVPVVHGRGRPIDNLYSLEQAEAILRLWYETPRIPPAEVTERAEVMLALDHGTLLNKAAKDPARWVKDLAIKYTGSARRSAPEGWEGIQIDADGKNVRYWE